MRVVALAVGFVSCANLCLVRIALTYERAYELVVTFTVIDICYGTYTVLYIQRNITDCHAMLCLAPVSTPFFYQIIFLLSK